MTVEGPAERSIEIMSPSALPGLVAFLEHKQDCPLSFLLLQPKLQDPDLQLSLTAVHGKTEAVWMSSMIP
jgi:hypothetical protein